MTSDAFLFEIGNSKAIDNRFQAFSFEIESPLVGLQGYESSTAIKALGFIMFNCTSSNAVLPSSNSTNKNKIADSVEMISNKNNNSQDVTTESVVLAGSYTFGIVMFIAGLVVGCLTCGSYIYIKKWIEIAIKKKKMSSIRPGA